MAGDGLRPGALDELISPLILVFWAAPIDPLGSTRLLEVAVGDNLPTLTVVGDVDCAFAQPEALSLGVAELDFGLDSEPVGHHSPISVGNMEARQKKLSQLKAQKQKMEALHKARLTGLARKALAEAFLLALPDRDAELRKEMLGKLSSFLAREDDRAVFGLKFHA